MASRNDDLRAANSIFHRDDVSAQAVSHVVVLDHHPFALRHDCFEFAQIENHIGAIEAADCSTDNLARAVLELLINHFLLDLANALHHRLFRCLRGDPSEILRRDFHLDFTANGRVRVKFARLGKRNLICRVRYIFDHEQFRQSADFAGLWIDVDPGDRATRSRFFSTRKGARWKRLRAGCRV